MALNSYLDGVAVRQLRASSDLLSDYDQKLRHHLDKYGEGLKPHRFQRPASHSFGDLVSHSVDYRQSRSRERRDEFLDRLNSSIDLSIERRPTVCSSGLGPSCLLRDRVLRTRYSGVREPAHFQMDALNRLKDSCMDLGWRERTLEVNPVPLVCRNSVGVPVQRYLPPQRQEIVIVREPKTKQKRLPVRKILLKENRAPVKKLSQGQRKGLQKIKKQIDSLLKPRSSQSVQSYARTTSASRAKSKDLSSLSKLTKSKKKNKSAVKLLLIN